MMKFRSTVFVAALMPLMALAATSLSAEKDSKCISVSEFKTQSLYRMVKLNWTLSAPLGQETVFQIIRSDSFVEGPYEEVATVPYNQKTLTYTYFDKSIGTESKYYYRLVLIGTEETCGPVAARPYFSPPTT